jgi:proteasome beta subunit
MVHEFSLKKGTTTVGIKTREGVVLAADKRATAGYLVANKKVKKILPLTEYCAITIAGTVAQAFFLADALRAQAQLYSLRNGERLAIKSIANIASNLLNSQKFYAVPVQLIMGGYDSSPQLLMVDFFGSVSEEEYIVTGSGSPVAMGVVVTNYKPDMTLKEAQRLCAQAISAAIQWDTATGEGIDVVTVSHVGIEQADGEKIRNLLS